MAEKPKYYSIGHVARITGLPTHTIRYWESMFSQLQPKKNRAGRRIYTSDDISMVKLIQDLLHNQRFTIKGAQEALENGTPPSPAPSPGGGGGQIPEEMQRRVERVKGKLEALIAELREDGTD